MERLASVGLRGNGRLNGTYSACRADVRRLHRMRIPTQSATCQAAVDSRETLPTEPSTSPSPASESELQASMETARPVARHPGRYLLDLIEMLQADDECRERATIMALVPESFGVSRRLEFVQDGSECWIETWPRSAKKTAHRLPRAATVHVPFMTAPNQSRDPERHPLASSGASNVEAPDPTAESTPIMTTSTRPLHEPGASSRASPDSSWGSRR